MKRRAIVCIVFWLLLLLNLGSTVNGASLPSKPNPARDPNFDPSEGIGRDQSDCKRRLTRDQDKKARELQDELTGKRTARINSKCNYAAWKSIRETFLNDEWNGQLKINIIRHLEIQLEKVKADIYTLEDLCIACADEALLECYQDAANPSVPGRCNCWRSYVKGNVTELYGDQGTDEACVIPMGGICHPLSEVSCQKGDYCDNESYTCQCTRVAHVNEPCGQFRDAEGEIGAGRFRAPKALTNLLYCLGTLLILNL